MSYSLFPLLLPRRSSLPKPILEADFYVDMLEDTLAGRTYQLTCVFAFVQKNVWMMGLSHFHSVASHRPEGIWPMLFLIPSGVFILSNRF